MFHTSEIAAAAGGAMGAFLGTAGPSPGSGSGPGVGMGKAGRKGKEKSKEEACVSLLEKQDSW